MTHSTHSPLTRRFRVLYLTALATLCQSSLAQEVPTINVGWTIPTEEAKYLMMRRPELFPELGKTYKINWVQFQGTAPIVQSMLAGAVDCGTMAPISLAQAATQSGLKAYIVAQHAEESKDGFSIYWAVKADSPIKTAADLKGKTIATNAYGTSVYYYMVQWLKQNGLDAKTDVKIVETGFPPAESALRGGRVDAAPFVPPFSGRAEEAGGLRKLFSLSEVQSPLVHILEGCSKTFVDSATPLAKAYVRDLAAAMRKIAADRNVAVEVDADIMKVPKPVLDRYVATASDMHRTVGAAPNLPSIATSFDIFHKAGVIDKPLKIDDFVRSDVMAR